MPTIKTVTDLRNDYDGISTLCNENPEPVFIERDGKTDLVAMSIEQYEAMSGETGIMKMIRETLSKG